MTETEFTIKSMPDYTFRTKRMTAIEINALATALDLQDVEQTIKTNAFCLEHLEVNIKGSWIQVKKENDYMPGSLEEDVIATKELVEWFLDNVIFKVFMKSSE